MICYFSFFLYLTLIIQMVSFVFYCPATVRSLLSCKVFLQISTDEQTTPSLLPPASTQLAGTTLLRPITTHTLPCINPTLRFHIFSIHEDLGFPLFADPIRALTESFESKSADVGNHLVQQLGRYLRWPRGDPVASRKSQGRQGTAGQSRPSPAMAKSTKRIAFRADRPNALRLP